MKFIYESFKQVVDLEDIASQIWEHYYHLPEDQFIEVDYGYIRKTTDGKHFLDIICYGEGKKKKYTLKDERGAVYFGSYFYGDKERVRDIDDIIAIIDRDFYE